MNERAKPPVVVARPLRRRGLPVVSRHDREFLPAALEILETPPPPWPVALMGVICAFALAALVWSYFGKLDVHAVAPGKIDTEGYSKVVEPLDAGKISAIHVKAGQSVRAGDVLFDLDPAEASADVRAAQDDLNASNAEIARIRFAIQSVRSIAATEAQPRGTQRVATQVSPQSAQPEPDDRIASIAFAIEALSEQPDPPVGWDASLPESFRLREQAVLRAELTELADSLKTLDKQMAQRIATKQRLNMSLSYQHSLMETLQQRVSTRQQAIALDVGTKINLYDAKEELQRSQAQLASDEGQLIESDAALAELESEKTKIVSQFVADRQNKLADASRKADDARETLTKGKTRLLRTRLVAPIDGVVEQLAVTTIGQVVTIGQQLAVITPIGGQLQIEALVGNLDIGFVKTGQVAEIKVDAFPFTRFGALHGQVVKIAPSAITEEEAKRVFGNATASANAQQVQSAGIGQSQTFVFPVTIAIDEPTIKINGAAIRLIPGMTASVEIKTDSRRVIDYLLSPLAKIASEAARER